jgi:hypothetical protein
VRTIRPCCSDAVRSATLAILVLGGSAAYAQSGAASSAEESVEFRKGAVEAGGIIGTTLPVSWLRAHPDRRIVAMGSLNIGRIMTNRLGRGPLSGEFEFLLEVTPLLILHQPPAYTVGVTASPLHMRWNFAPISKHRVRPFAEASGGIVYTNHAVPVGTTSFNFIDQAGFGLRFPTGTKQAWVAGYRFQHISNAGRVQPNPGANFNFAYVGVSFAR